MIKTRLAVRLEGNDNYMNEYTYDSDRYIVPQTYPNIYPVKVSEAELATALDKITRYFIDNQINCLYLDLKERNEALAPTKVMTIKEIEKALGHKIKIVGDHKHGRNK